MTCYNFRNFGDKTKMLYGNIKSFIAFPLIPKQTTLNNYEWPFYVKLWCDLE